MESGVIKYDAPGSFEGITEISYDVIDALGNVVFSGTVKVSKLEKKVVANIPETPEPEPIKKTWKDYVWIPIVMLFMGVVTVIWKKLSNSK